MNLSSVYVLHVHVCSPYIRRQETSWIRASAGSWAAWAAMHDVNSINTFIIQELLECLSHMGLVVMVAVAMDNVHGYLCKPPTICADFPP